MAGGSGQGQKFCSWIINNLLSSYVIVINHASSLLMKYKHDARGREAHEGKVYISLINYTRGL